MSNGSAGRGSMAARSTFSNILARDPYCFFERLGTYNRKTFLMQVIRASGGRDRLEASQPCRTLWHSDVKTTMIYTHVLASLRRRLKGDGCDAGQLRAGDPARRRNRYARS